MRPIRSIDLQHIAVYVALCLVSVVAHAQDSLLINGGNPMGTVTAGYFGLQWGEEAEEGGTWRLERSADPAFDNALVVYDGPDHGTFESGLSDGTYYYRLIRQGRIGPTYSVNVTHHSLNRAFLFLGTGAVVFLALLFVLLRADRALRRGGMANDPSSNKRGGD